MHELDQSRSKGASRSPDSVGSAQSESESQDLRFEFGENWAKFLELLDEQRICMARESIQNMLGVDSLTGKTFLDAGCGSGLFSLVAAQLDAQAIVSFDYDRGSVGCAATLKDRFFPNYDAWTIQQGDCLDKPFLDALPKFDVVYSWGVLHHTGNMWQAMDNVAQRVGPNGLLYISIYNDQKVFSNAWRKIKRFYCKGALQRTLVLLTFIPLLFSAGLVIDVLKRRNPLTRYRQPRIRGMSTVRDWYDWLGGYPFEVARPEQVLSFLRDRGFVLRELKTVGGGSGCNEYVFSLPTQQ